MNLKKKLPLSFFEKGRPNTSKENFKDIISIKWPKDVLNGKKKVVVELSSLAK